ncbi:MAG TPA: CrcB family protein [Nitriliruptorales bacterium]|nr:CrcB family protein [Nitriliruptorales bacterium]
MTGRTALRARRRRAAVLVGGVAGTALRLGVATVVPVSPTEWPWPTFTVNLSGAFLLGYLLSRALAAATPTTLTVPLLGVGVLGSYTTFSTLAVEVVTLSGGERLSTALAYGAASVAAGATVAWLGIRLAERRP